MACGEHLARTRMVDDAVASRSRDQNHAVPATGRRLQLESHALLGAIGIRMLIRAFTVLAFWTGYDL